jgi:hypothetical protein
VRNGFPGEVLQLEDCTNCPEAVEVEEHSTVVVEEGREEDSIGSRIDFAGCGIFAQDTPFSVKSGTRQVETDEEGEKGLVMREAM